MKTFWGIVFISLGCLIFLSLVSFTPEDIPFLSFPFSKSSHNLIGIVGEYLSLFLLFIFGKASYFFPFYFFFSGVDKLGVIRFKGISETKVISAFAFLFLIIFLPTFLSLFPQKDTSVYKAGGFIGFLFVDFFRTYLGVIGSFISLLAIIILTSLLLFWFFLTDVFLEIKSFFLKLVKFFSPPLGEEKVITSKVEKKRGKVRKEVSKPEIKPEIKVYSPKATPSNGKISSSVPQMSEKKVELPSQQTPKKKFVPADYKLPSVDILKTPPLLNVREVKEDIKANIKNLEETLSDFGVEVKVVSVQKGPVVTMYELKLLSGVKIQKITALSDDIALAMKSSSVRIVAPIPGKGTVGVEVPNEKKHFVYLREIVEEKAFVNAPSKLTLAIGKNVKGEAVVADLKQMPHLLIAGTTGSGKTVCVNALISSILFKAKPNEVKFILVDPKMVELSFFSNIPHLCAPLIFEAKKAVFALNWAVEEMERRYKLLAAEGARNIEIYNKKSFRLPYIVIIIDELADLMSIAKESIETAIQRLSQLARAVGMHFILATQRPSVDVITGVIKANLPARISFKVASKVDSRTVLDTVGAEKLLGKGDLLFLKPGASKLIRAQGCFIDDEDIRHLTDFIKAQGGPTYEEGIINAQKRVSQGTKKDELFEDAVRVVLNTGQASASVLQRRLRVGYARAARLLDLMEEEGIVGPFLGSKAREILVDPEEFEKRYKKVEI